MIEGLIESLSPEGLVQGWVRDTTHTAPCHVRILYAEQLVAEAVGDLFRADLLRAGTGHGHYGFCAQLRRPLPEGRRSVVLHLPRRGISASMGVVVPALRLAGPAAVESLLQARPGWTTSDLLAFPFCLDLDANLASMGPPRFVDGVFRFVLDRWPSAAEARLQVESLKAGRITPTALLIELLRSRERADLDPQLPSPFDPAFPFPSFAPDVP